MHRAPEQRVDHVIDVIYGAAVGATGWDRVAEALRDLSGAIAAGVSLRPETPDGVFRQHWAGLDPEFERRYVDGLYRDDPWVEGAQRMPVGRTWCGGRFIAERELVRTRFYNEACAPFGYRDIAGCIIASTPGYTITYGMFVDRVAEERSFEHVDRVLPHLARALALTADAPVRWMTDLAHMLETLNMPAAVVDADARLIVANAGGRAVLERGEGVRLDRGRVGCRRPSVQQALHAAIARTAGGLEPRPCPIGVARPRRQRALAVSVMPLPRHLGGSSRALVVMIDPDAALARSAAAVARVFDLSPAEARLTAALSQGLDPRAMADAFGLSVHTVRTQMRSVFRKTGCHRQADLAALVATLAPLGGGGE